MSRYIKYPHNDGKNMPFTIEDDNVLVKHIDLWTKILKKLGTKFHSNPVHDEKYIKTKVKSLNSVVNKIFSDNKVLKESAH